MRAAGGLVIRRSGTGEPLIAVIHRPSHDDWSLPKGKLLAGEDWIDGALREVEEETGWRCEASDELESASYLDRKGRRKLVRYWLMSAIEGDFEVSDEVDELRWLNPADAAALLDYDHDLRLLEALAAR